MSVCLMPILSIYPSSHLLSICIHTYSYPASHFMKISIQCCKETLLIALFITNHQQRFDGGSWQYKYCVVNSCQQKPECRWKLSVLNTSKGIFGHSVCMRMCNLYICSYFYVHINAVYAIFIFCLSLLLYCYLNLDIPLWQEITCENIFFLPSFIMCAAEVDFFI